MERHTGKEGITMKFEMNRYTLGMILTEPGLFKSEAIYVRKYSLLDHPVVINTDKPDGIVQLGRDTVDLSYTDNIRGSLESLLYAAKRREGGLTPEVLHRVNINGVWGARGSFDKEDYLQVSRGSSGRASGRTFRALLEVMKTASESPEGSLTLFVVSSDNEVYSSYGRLTHVLGRMLGNVLNDNKAKTLLFENRTIQVISKNKMELMCFDGHETGKRINVVYDHTIQEGK